MPALLSVLENAVVASTISLGFYLMASLYSQHSMRNLLAKQLQQLQVSNGLLLYYTHAVPMLPDNPLLSQSDLDREKEKRAADRSGRIRAEQQLKEARLQLATEQALRPSAAGATSSSNCNDQDPAKREEEADGSRASHADLSVFPLRPIGFLRSCFTHRYAMYALMNLGVHVPRNVPICVQQGNEYSSRKAVKPDSLPPRCGQNTQD